MKMKTKQRVRLNERQYLTHFFIVGLLLLIPILLFGSLQEESGNLTEAEKLLVLSFVIPAIVSFFIQLRRLRFKKIPVVLTHEELSEILARMTKNLEWQCGVIEGDFVRAYRSWNWTGSWGEMITIKLVDDGVLINSICDPNSIFSVLSYGWNRKNVRAFTRNIIDVKKGIPVKEVVSKDKGEWSAKRIVVRLLMYPLGVIVIGFCILVIVDFSSLKNAMAAVMGIGVFVAWFYADIKLILKQRSLKK